MFRIRDFDSLSDFQPLSIAKVNIFFINNQGFTEIYFSDKVHAILIEEVPIQTMWCDGASVSRLTSLIGLKHLHQPFQPFQILC